MTKLREAVLLEMRLRGLSPRTNESYVHALEELARYYWRPLESLTCREVQDFLDHLIGGRKLAWSTTGRYMHVTAEMIRKTQSPLDTLGELCELRKR